jgi:hypothetical protein
MLPLLFLTLQEYQQEGIVESPPARGRGENLPPPLGCRAPPDSPIPTTPPYKRPCPPLETILVSAAPPDRAAAPRSLGREPKAWGGIRERGGAERWGKERQLGEWEKEERGMGEGQGWVDRKSDENERTQLGEDLAPQHCQFFC